MQALGLRHDGRMYSHIFVGVGDFDRALAFYTPVMAALGLQLRFVERDRPWAGWQSHPEPRPLFLIGKPFDGQAFGPSTTRMTTGPISETPMATNWRWPAIR